MDNVSQAASSAAPSLAASSSASSTSPSLASPASATPHETVSTFSERGTFFRADGTIAPSAQHVMPHPFGTPHHRKPEGHSGPAIGAPATGSATYMTVAQLALLTMVAVASLRSLPAMAGYGLSSVVLYVIPALLFLVPSALVAAELATGWKGGIYTWVREAFGERWGFVAIWLQWIQNVVWFPMQLSFIAVCLTYVFGISSLSGNGVYIAIVIIALYWLATAITLLGRDVFAKVGSYSGLIGTFIPAMLLIILGAWWLCSGHPSYTPLTAQALLPPFTGVASIVLIVSNVLAYAGMEVNAVHANDLAHPGREFPRAIAIATLLIMLVFILPTLAIAVAVPQAKLGLIDGINLAFAQFFHAWGIDWATALISLLIAVGALAAVITWIAGPSRGLLAAARAGFLPPVLQQRNKAGVQVGILLAQAVVVSVLGLLFVLIPNGNTAFSTLIDMAAALYLIMYCMMFAAAVRLRASQPRVVRTYRVPALPLVAGIGFLGCAVAFVFAFIEPSQLPGLSPLGYFLLVAAVVVVLGAPPLVLYQLRRPQWDMRSALERETAEEVLVNPQQRA